MIKPHESSKSSAHSQVVAAQFRTNRLRWAVGTSVLSKVVTALLTLIAIPIAIRSLGVSNFALYATITAISGWFGVLMLNMGPALVIRIAKAAVHGEVERERQIVSSAFMPVVILSSFLAVLAIGVVWFMPVNTLFNSELINGNDNTARIGLTILSIVCFFRSILQVMENAQAGYQEQYLLNIRGLVGNVFTIASLFIVFWRPEVCIMIVAMQVPTLLVQIANVVFFLIKRPFLLPRFSSFDWKESHGLIADGIMFSLAANLSAFLCHQFPITVLGALPGGESRTAILAASMNLVISAFGVVSMIFIPMWSAVSDSLSRGDVNWAQQASRRTIINTMVYAFFIGFTLALFGKPLFKLWLGDMLQPSSLFFVCIGIYFIFLVWEYAHYMILVGIGQIKIASAIYMTRSLVAVVAVFILARTEQDWTTFVGLTISTVVVTAFSYPLILRRFLTNRFGSSRLRVV